MKDIVYRDRVYSVKDIEAQFLLISSLLKLGKFREQFNVYSCLKELYSSEVIYLQSIYTNIVFTQLLPKSDAFNGSHLSLPLSFKETK